ncbi:MAG: response regulator [Magnetococcales bacterium]|nr:response regulator [Magnetococcales bacterium]
MSKKRIYIVEDEGITVMALEDSLASLGYTVCGNAASGIEALKGIKDSSPDLVLMDIVLQGEMDGIEVASKVYDEFHIPVVFLTAHSDSETLNRAKISKPYGYIVKPFEERELHSNIEIILYKHHLEQELDQNKERYWQLFEHSPEALCVINPEDKNFVEVNNSALRLFGYNRDEFVKQQLSDISLEPDEAKKADFNQPQTDDSSSLPHFFKKKNGSLFVGEIDAWSISHNNKQMLIASIRDISKRVEEEENERLAAFQAGVMELSSSLLHNIGNAIMGISHRAERLDEAAAELLETGNILSQVEALVEKKLAKGESHESILTDLLAAISETGINILELGQKRIQKDALRIKDGVGHIADIIEIQQHVAHPNFNATNFELKQLFEDAIAIQADTLEKYKINVILKVSDDIEKVDLPRGQLLQVMINLIKNGREAISSRTDDVVGGKIYLIANIWQPGWLEIRVVDNGIGISPGNRDKIFKYGFSTKNRSTGFGLFSVRKFIVSLHGSIDVESGGFGKGCEFIIRLPIN